MTAASFFDRIIRYSYYTLFFLVPLVVTNNTSELFEFNKMWLTYALTIIIVSSWLLKSVKQGRFVLQRTPLDIPILLFLLAHILSTIFSLDQRVSMWGYYSRFNGGLLSIITYILLFYAFVSNFRVHDAVVTAHEKKSQQQPIETKYSAVSMVKRLLIVSLISGTIVALWGLPSHFGKDPTCLLFRGSLDVSCWTESFQPTVRIFSTVGQPAWLAAYLSILLPIAMAYFLRYRFMKKMLLPGIASFLLILLFYIDLLYANTRAGFLGFWAANILFWSIIFIRKLVSKDIFLKYFLLINVFFIIITFFLGTPMPQLNPLTYPSLRAKLSTSNVQPTPPPATPPAPVQPLGEFAGTDSGTIRLFVWQGAIAAWKVNPLFGTGVETFAFAYYKHRPAAHNTTSEWDYLYNKAHNEYLNYLTTTGIFGLGSYLAIIGLFVFLFFRRIFLQKQPDIANIDSYNMEGLLSTALIAAFVSILISNFFGFSVVIVNVYFFMLPVFALILLKLIKTDHIFAFPSLSHSTSPHKISLYGQSVMAGIVLLTFYFLFLLMNFWRADVAYAYGFNLDRVSEYQTAYPYLEKAVSLRGAEPLFQDELALNSATLATAFFNAKDTTSAAQLADRAINLSNSVVANNPNNIVYWKNRVRIFYTLAQIDSKYFPQALEAMQKAQSLAPTDAKVLYNLAVLHGQMGNPEEGIKLLDEVLKLKPNYSDVYFAKGLFYRALATDENDNVIKPDIQQKAVENMNFILENFNKDDKRALESLQSWGVR